MNTPYSILLKAYSNMLFVKGSVIMYSVLYYTFNAFCGQKGLFNFLKLKKNNVGLLGAP